MKKVAAEEECGECIGVPLHNCTNICSRYLATMHPFVLEERNPLFFSSILSLVAYIQTL